MPQTSTLIELINDGNITPENAHSYFVSLAKTKPQYFKDKYLILMIHAQPTLRIVSSHPFNNHKDAEHFVSYQARGEFMYIRTEDSKLIVGLKTDTICFRHHFEEDRDYTESISDRRTKPTVPFEVALKQLHDFFANPVKAVNTKRSVS